ncbi:hypothetical protein DHEL01_v202344 [Diaporthe helianthi]|uniref:Uncharacterized protein n=1 Tax=Diaporthe helianthi TaxID=158607 RepID=A0A2P5I9T4_DIAHE|nr:hypothetical protein DHEL01_v202344 [Diaporthe helianthi]
MRFITIAALFTSLAAALPAAVPAEQGTSVATRGDNAAELSIAARGDLAERQTYIPWSQTRGWPDDQFTGGGLSAQYQALNLKDGNYQFTLWTSAPPNSPDIKFRLTSGSILLFEKITGGVGRKETLVVPKTGDNYTIWIGGA